LPCLLCFGGLESLELRLVGNGGAPVGVTVARPFFLPSRSFKRRLSERREINRVRLLANWSLLLVIFPFGS
jgi:hypothetical protein